jgi:hypothetical protein
MKNVRIHVTLSVEDRDWLVSRYGKAGTGASIILKRDISTERYMSQIRDTKKKVFEAHYPGITKNPDATK